MLFTFPHITRGWFTEDQFIRGPDGTRTLASGLAGRTSRSDSDLELAGSAALGGAGRIGDSTGAADIQSMAATGTTPGVERSTTGAVSITQDADLMADAVEATAVEFTTIQEQSPDPSTEIARLREDMRNPAARRAEFTRELSAGTTAADRSGVFPRVAAPASAAEASTAAAVFMAEAVVVPDANRGYIILVSS